MAAAGRAGFRARRVSAEVRYRRCCGAVGLNDTVDPAGSSARRVTLARIVGVYGIKGWVRVQSFTRPMDNLLDYRRWWLNTATPFQTVVLEARPQGNVIVASIVGPDGQPITDRDIAARYTGVDVQVERADMPEPPPGSYYWADLIGLAVRSVSGHALGTVTDMMSNGAQDVLMVQDEAVQRLIPFVRGPIVHEVDMTAGTILVDWEPDY